MSTRIAHRPRPQAIRHLSQTPRYTSKNFFRTRWTYRRFTIPYEKRPLGQGLLLVPFGYRLVHRFAIGA